MSVYPRIIYGANDEFHVDVDRHFNALDTPNRNHVVENESDSGITETLEFFDRDTVLFGWKHLTPQQIEELRKWFEYVKDGTSFELRTDRDMRGLWTFEGDDMVSNNGDTMEYTHAGTKYFLNPDTGLLEAATANTPLFPEGRFGRCFQVETEITNLVTNPEDFSAWSTLGSATVNANFADLPDPLGTNLADKVNVTATNDGVEEDTGQAIGTTSATFSVWINAYDYADLTLTIEIRHDYSGGGQLEAYEFEPEAGWHRYEVTYESGGSQAGDYVVRISQTSTNTNTSFLAFGAQLETNVWASSYRSTGTCSDDAYVVINGGEWDDLSFRGTVGMWIKFPAALADMPASRILWKIKDTSSYGIVYLWVNASNQIELRVNDAGSTNEATHVADSSTTYAADTWYHVVAAWDLVDDKILKIVANALTRSSAVLYEMQGGVPYGIDLGHGTPGEPWSVMVDDFFVRTDFLSDEVIDKLYNAGRGLGTRRTRWPALQLVDHEFRPQRQKGANRWDFQITAKEVLS